jgi:hypothetical protein
MHRTGPFSRLRWLSILLVLGLFGRAFPAAGASGQTGWTSKTLPKQAAPSRIAISRDGKFSAEVIPDMAAKLPPPMYSMPIRPDAVLLRDFNGKALTIIRSTKPKMQSSQLAFSANGKTLAIGGIDGVVHIVEMQKRTIVRRFAVCRNPLQALTIVGDDRLLVFDGTDALTAWSLKTRKKLARLAFANPAQEHNPRHFLATDDMNVYAVKGKDLRKTGPDLAKWQTQAVLPGRIVGLLVSANRSTLALGIDTGKGFQPNKVRVDPKNPLGGKMLIDLDYSLSIREAGTLKETRSFKLDCKSLFFSMTLVPGRSDRIVTEKEGSFMVWDIKSGKKVDGFRHPVPRKDGAFLYSLLPASGGKLKSYCMEYVLGYGPPPVFPVRQWTPPD